jgi:hypothetical protein
MIKRQLLRAALGLAMVVGSGFSVSPASAEGIVLHGCVAVVDDDTFVVSTGTSGHGPHGAGAAHRTYEVQIPEGSELQGQVSNGCGAIAMYEQDGVWYAQSVLVSGDGEGNLEYQTTEVTGDGEGNATVEQHEGTWTPPGGPFRNR